ncbi:MAG: SDR family oxidoreductase [Rhodothermales bacterium]|nr:SDR family oxidoreductase [Rhodothermales bacterium]
MTFDNRIVWITGASSGIGAALARAWAEQGAHLVLSARRHEALHAVRDACAHPERHLVLPLDLTAPETFQDAARQVLGRYGQIDVLVHNGGISQRSPAAETAIEVDRRIMEVNFFGAVALTKAVLPSMLERGRGHLVVISSLVGKFGTPMRSAYAASKHALHGFFGSLRAEVHDAGLRVTIVCPGYVRTDVSRNALRGDGTRHGRMDANQEHGLNPDRCAHRILRAVAKERAEVVIAGTEGLAVYLNRFFPGLFRRVVRRVRPS